MACGVALGATAGAGGGGGAGGAGAATAAGSVACARSITSATEPAGRSGAAPGGGTIGAGGGIGDCGGCGDDGAVGGGGAVGDSGATGPGPGGPSSSDGLPPVTGGGVPGGRGATGGVPGSGVSGGGVPGDGVPGGGLPGIGRGGTTGVLAGGGDRSASARTVSLGLGSVSPPSTAWALATPHLCIISVLNQGSYHQRTGEPSVLVGTLTRMAQSLFPAGQPMSGP